MARVFGLAGLFVGLVLVLPTLGADDKDDKKKDDPAAKKADAPKGDKEKGDKDDDPKKGGDKEKMTRDKAAKKDKKDKLTWGAELVGKLTVDGSSTGDFTLHVTQKIMEPDYGAQQQFAQQSMQLQQQKMRIAMARRPQELQQATQQYYQTMMQLAQTQARLYKPKDVHYDVQLRFADKMKVRLLTPPVEYDDKGNMKKFTAKELQALRGTEDLPGYTGDADTLRTGQIVKVYLAKSQVPASAIGKMKGKAGAVAAKKKKDDDGADEELGSARPEAVMILVLQDPPAQ
jgi:hypothetical protein